MPVGLQVWDSNGDISVDLSERLGLAIGVIDTGTSNGSISVPQFQGNTPFHYSLALADNSSTSPRVSISGTTLSWVFVDIIINGQLSPRVSSTILYGVT